jgi:SAM-dependent methyltransferase
MDYDKYALLWQSKKSSNTHYAHQYLEKPAMQKLLGDIKGKNLDILDLGCGSGEDVKMFSQGNRVVGLDNSPELLSLAQIDNPDCQFWCVDLNTGLIPNSQKFDIVYSSLTMHYIKDWDHLLKQLYLLTKDGGRIIISTHHPLKWGSRSAKSKEYNEFIIGYRKNKDKAKSYSIYGDYLNTYPIYDKLFQQLDIVHYNRSLSSMFQSFNNSGFTVTQMLEPQPMLEAKDKIPDFYEVHSKIPLFVIWELVKITL